MTAVLARRPADIAARVVDLVDLFECDPLPIRDQEAREILAGNRAGLRAWDDFTAALEVLWDIHLGENPLHYVEQDPTRMSPVPEDAEATAVSTARRQHADARAALLEAVAVAADVDQLRRAANAMRGIDEWIRWAFVAFWLDRSATTLAGARRLADCPDWQDVDLAIRMAAAYLGEPRCEVGL